MLIAISGGTGFLGGHLTDALLAAGHQVRILSRRPMASGQALSQQKAVSFYTLSLTDDEKLLAALSGCDAIAHLSGINREIAPGDFADCHVQSTKHILLAAQKANLKKIVYVSYLRARPDKLSHYLQSKWDGEEVIRGGALDYTVIKPGLCFGPRDQMVSSIVHTLNLTPGFGFFATVGWPEKTVRPVFVADMVLIMVKALTAAALSRKTVAVVGPEELKLSDAVKRVGKVIGKPVLIVPTPAFAQYALAWSMEQTMRYPIVTVAQIRMLAEGMSEATGNLDPLPIELQPKTYFTEAQISLALKQIG